MSASGAARADLIAELLGRHYRDPSRKCAQALREAQGPGCHDVVLRFALGLPVELSDPARSGRTAAARRARDAAFYIRRCLARDDATHYEVLGLPPDASADAVRENFRLLMRLIHPDRQRADEPWPQGFVARVNRAHSVLKAPEARARYDRELMAKSDANVGRTGTVAPARPRAALRRPTQGIQPGQAPTLPEWLTVGVGVQLREHPAIAWLVAIVVGSAAIIGTLAWESREATITRDPQPESVAAAPATVTARAAEREVLHPAVPPVAPSVTLAQPAGAAGFPPPASAALSQRTAAVRESGATKLATGVPAREEMPEPRAGRVMPTASIPAPPASPPMNAPRLPQPAAVPPEGAIPVAAAETAAVASGGDPARVAAAMATSMPPVAALPAEQVPTGLPPETAEIEAFFAAFVESYEKGRLDAFAALFDDDAEMNLRHGRLAIRGVYDEHFRQSSWRRMQLTRINWRRVGDRALAKGEISVRIGWRDGREVEHHVAVDIELVRRDGRALIAKLSQQPRN